MADTIRKQILQKIAERLENMVPDDPNEDDYRVEFSVVSIGPLGEPDNKKRYRAGVVPGQERKKNLYPLVECSLVVDIEFQMTVNRGDEVPAMEAETVIGDIQRHLLTYRKIDGLAVDLRENGNEVQLDDPNDKTVEGLVQFVVVYRHAIDDPRKC